MNKKGNAMGSVGAILMVAITVIVGLVLFSGGIAPNIGAATLTATYDTSAGNGAAITPVLGANTELLDSSGSGVQSVSSFVAVNATSGAAIHSGNYTITTRTIDETGELSTQLNATGGYAGAAWNVSYTLEPLGYISDAGGRSLAGLIAVFTALAILSVVLYRKELFDF